MTYKVNLFSKCIINRFLTENIVNFKQYSVYSTYKILFFGSDNISLSSLKKINDLRKTTTFIKKLDLVTANNPKNNSIVEKYALSEKMKIIKWPLENLQYCEYDIGLIVAFGHLIKQDLLEKFPLGMVNVHPSLLPRWRGAAPIIHTILHGDQESGVTLMKIEPDKFDVGKIINQIRVPVPNDIKLPDLSNQLSEIGAQMLLECVQKLPDSLQKLQSQSNNGVTHAKKITKKISEVRWSEMDAKEVYNLYRAVYGIYNLSTTFRNRSVKLFDAFLANYERNAKTPAGTFEFCDKTSSIRVVCKDNKYINFRFIRVVGKRKITALDFYNGYLKNNENSNFLFC